MTGMCDASASDKMRWKELIMKFNPMEIWVLLCPWTSATSIERKGGSRWWNPENGVLKKFCFKGREVKEKIDRWVAMVLKL